MYLKERGKKKIIVGKICYFFALYYSKTALKLYKTRKKANLQSNLSFFVRKFSVSSEI